jgi:hypothetical protein
MMATQTFDKRRHRFLIDDGAFANVPHIVIERQIEQEKIVDLPQYRFVQATHHVGDKEAGNAQVP